MTLGRVVHAAYLIVRIVACALGIGFLVLIYFNASVNARANREDEVVSMPGTDTDGDALSRAVAAAAGQPAIPGNAVEIYQNGDEIFPPMLDSIAQARSSVHFVTYVYHAGAVPSAFADAFASAAQRGVAVRIVLDSDGAKHASPALIARMRAAREADRTIDDEQPAVRATIVVLPVVPARWPKPCLLYTSDAADE